jgi:phosphoserine aminotransferase
MLYFRAEMKSQIKRNGNFKMAHQFTVNETIHGVSIEDFTRLVAQTSLHEAVCKRILGITSKFLSQM